MLRFSQSFLYNRSNDVEAVEKQFFTGYGSGFIYSVCGYLDALS